jgi:hypothetical protein
MEHLVVICRGWDCKVVSQAHKGLVLPGFRIRDHSRRSNQAGVLAHGDGA